MEHLKLKNNIKIYIKFYIKTAPTCFGAVTPSSGSALLVLAKVTAVKIVKIIEAEQASLCNSYKNTKLKLLKTNSAVWFNKMCKIKHLKPNYVNIKVNGKKSQGYFNNCNFSKDELMSYLMMA